MSQENVEVVNALLDQWSAPDHGLSNLPRYLGPSIELESPFSSVVGEPYRGYAGIERWFRDIDEQFSEWSILASDVRDLGDQVLVIGTAMTRGRTSDVTLEIHVATVVDFGADDRVRRLRIYWDVEEALNAVGLEK